MALVPIYSSLWRDWWEDFERPHRFLDTHFRRVLKYDDFWNPLCSPVFDWYFRPWDRVIERRVTVSKTTTTTAPPPLPDLDEFRVVVDVQKFAPYEILVKTVGSSIIIEAKHEEHKCCGGVTTTEFMRRYELPCTHDINRVMCNLSTDGVLTITAPKFGTPRPRERIVPIDRTVFPAIKS
ncbi:protein lethal(2)essential for life-like [Venturia canescens]|uniref:protein lethal(2)essential for life-like n=1 Tax=Venturia canescens TaxID=32260 RepID=UPI001C9C5A25|nr:protein lethal(2)essential for life-like [Venturia canescens]